MRFTPPRTTLIGILFLLCSKSVFAQAPTNDVYSCASPAILTPSTSCVNTLDDLYLSTIGTPTSTCGTTYDVWYAFDVPAGVTAVDITVNANGGGLIDGTNTFIQAFSESGCAL